MTDGQRKRRKVIHTRMRLRERFGLDVSRDFVKKMYLMRGRPIVYLAGGLRVHELEIQKRPVLIVFNGRQPVSAITHKMLSVTYI